jgi:hypothetical protein
MSNKLLEPIHGISLQDYVAITKSMTAGIAPDLIYKAMGINEAIFDEINEAWPKRMAEDESYEITMLFSQYYADETPHPRLAHLSAEISEEGAENLERLKTDRYFYEELSAARDAAFAYGIDGAQWMLDTFGINLADFQTVAMQVWAARDLDSAENSEEQLEFAHYRSEKKEEYEAFFAKQQGGNVADDINF